MKKRVLTAAIISLLSGVASADTYQAEAGLFYNNTDADTLTSDYDTYSAAGSVYFKPVDDSKGPRLEAAFLDRASGISASYVDPDESAFDEAYNVGGRFVLNNDTIIQASYSDYDFDKRYQVGLGTYLSDTSDVVLSYSKVENSDLETLAATYHQVVKLAGTSSLGYSVNAGYVDAQVDEGYSVGGDVTYYVNPSFGFGATVSLADYNNLEVNSYGLQASYFITPAFFVQGYAKTTDYDGPDEDNIGVGASIRF